MRPALLLLALFASQALVVSRAWLAAYAPDPLLPVAAFAALYWPRRGLLLPVLVVGWLRALVLLEPAGGQVLCVLGSTLIVASLRPALLSWGRAGYVLAALVQAGCWSLCAAAVSALSGQTITGGRELVLGALLAVPLAGLACAAGRSVTVRP